jgi:AcrR family transcriptional regulator
MAYTQNPLTFEVKNTAEKISQRQLDIIHASGKLLSTNGSSGLTVKNLAKSMKFSEAALYRHYKSKEAIIVSMLDFVASELENHFNSIDKDKTPRERFLDYNKCQFDYFKANPHFVKVAFSDGLFDSTDKINLALNGVTTVLQKHLIPIIMDGKLDQTFPMEIHSEKIVHILLATIKLHMSKWSSTNYSTDLERTGMDLAQTMLKIFK